MNLEELKFLLNKYKLTPNKIRGQNFLISDEVLETIISKSNISDKDLILEVGPGLGALTQKLADTCYQLVAFEIDKNLKKPLDKSLEVNNNLEIIWQDILSLDDKQWEDILAKYHRQDYKVVANIPYYLTGKFVQKFITAKHKPLSMTLMVQEEVAKRVVDDKKQSLLSLSVSFYAQAQIISRVLRNNFYPQPKVDSAILYIYDIKNWPHQVDERKTWQLIKRGFAYKRKKLFNNLLTDPNIDKSKLKSIFEKNHLDLNIRAEKLSPDDWIKLAKSL